jgi:hypothetical protein
MNNARRRKIVLIACLLATLFANGQTSSFDPDSTVLNPGLFAGSDMCAKISAAFQFAISSGWTSATVDARRRQFVGQQSCAGSPFAGVSNNGSFTGTLLTQGAQIITNVSIVVPGGILWDGSGPRSLASPVRQFAGTSVQPSATFAGGPVIQLGAPTDPSSPQGVRIKNMAIGCLAPNATYIPGTGSIGVLNLAAQEMSGGENLIVNGCQTSFDIESTSGYSWITSGFDSSGFTRSAVLMPNDPAAVGFMYGGSSNGLAHVYGLHDVTCTGVPVSTSPGAANGTCVDLEGTDIVIDHVRFAYVNKGIVIGATKPARNILVDNITITSNLNNGWTSLIELGQYATYLITIINAQAGGPPAGGDGIVLKDVNYPGGECDLTFAKEGALGFYSRGVGGAANGVVLSTTRTACKSTGISFNFQTNAIANAGQTSLNLISGSGITVKNTSAGTVSVSGAGLTTTKTVKGSTGANCTMTFTAGVMTATTCP